MILSKRADVNYFFFDLFFQRVLFNLWANLLTGFIRLVLLVFFACRTLVRCRVFFMRCAWAVSGGAEQSATLGTVRPARDPVSHLHFNETAPLGDLFHTNRCSVINSCARMTNL